MCGIIGYIGNKNPVDILISGLKCLEYRGYDSSGIAIKNNDDVQIIKSVGKISKLEEKIGKENLIDASIGIAHTRWATHGAANIKNAHPHKSGRVIVVHNGIIENYSLIKEKLENKKVVFNSDTDTEVVAALINYYYDCSHDPLKAINMALEEFKGSYALGIMFDDINKLYAVRKDSPLIIGVLDKEYFLASDITAIISKTDRYILLDTNEVAELSYDGINITKNFCKVDKKINIADVSSLDVDKLGYDHYMLKEIMEQSTVLEKTLDFYLNNWDKLVDLSKYEEIHIVACGSAMYAGMIGKYLLEEYANTRVLIDVASEYRYKNIIYDRKTLVILISQSGETADTIAAMRKAKDMKIDTLAIVNVKTSTIARESDKQIFIEAGPEIAVATTKAYILQVLVLSLISIKTANVKGLLSDFDDIIDETHNLVDKLKKVVNDREKYYDVALKIYDKEDVFFIGRGIDYAICLEGSLKLKEVSYIHSEAYQAGELKHGTISLIDDGMPVFAIITDDLLMEKTMSNVLEVKSRGADVFVISSDNLKCNSNIVVPKTNKFLQPILVVPVLQLIAYETAKLRNCDIDKPKNLAKSVTVE